MKLFIILYWTWLSISLLILGRRLLHRVTRSVARSVSPEPVPFGVAQPVDSVHTDHTDHNDHPDHPEYTDHTDDEPPSAPLSGGRVDAFAHAPEHEPDTDRRMPVDPHAWPTQPRAGRPLAGTVFAPLTPPTPSLERMRINRTYLADALQGISMPCNLAPLSNVEGVDPARRAVFSTSSANADMVGSSIASELGRLGFSLEALSSTEALARRGDDAVNVRINAIGPAPKKGPADPRFPTAAGNSVVLDLEIT